MRFFLSNNSYNQLNFCFALASLCVFLFSAPAHALTDERNVAQSKLVSSPIIVKDLKNKSVITYHKSYALLIGVSEYNSNSKASWGNLTSIPEELNTVESALKDKGFEVIRVNNPNSLQLHEAFKSFVLQYGYEENNRLLFYFAGHGFQNNKGNKGFLVPSDAPVPSYTKNGKHHIGDDKGFRDKAFHMTDILGWSEKMNVKHALFLFDSCFSGAIFKTRNLPNLPDIIQPLSGKKVRQFITAGKAGEEVPATSSFTPAFVDALKLDLGDLNKDGYISGTELGIYLRDSQRKHTKQTSQYGKIDDFELSRGDFLFVSKNQPTEEQKKKLLEQVFQESIENTKFNNNVSHINAEHTEHWQMLAKNMVDAIIAKHPSLADIDVEAPLAVKKMINRYFHDKKFDTTASNNQLVVQAQLLHNPAWWQCACTRYSLNYELQTKHGMDSGLFSKINKPFSILQWLVRGFIILLAALLFRSLVYKLSLQYSLVSKAVIGFVWVGVSLLVLSSCFVEPVTVVGVGEIVVK